MSLQSTHESTFSSSWFLLRKASVNKPGMPKKKLLSTKAIAKWRFHHTRSNGGPGVVENPTPQGHQIDPPGAKMWGFSYSGSLLRSIV